MNCPDCTYQADSQADLEEHQTIMSRHDLHEEALA
jgi:hypothetical protein